jgi:hypothetical protein
MANCGDRLSRLSLYGAKRWLLTKVEETTLPKMAFLSGIRILAIFSLGSFRFLATAAIAVGGSV